MCSPNARPMSSVAPCSGWLLDWMGRSPLPAFPRDGAGSERWPCTERCVAMRRWPLVATRAVPHASQPLRQGAGADGGRPAPKSPRDGMKLAFPGALGESESNRLPPEPSLTLLPALFPGFPREGEGAQQGIIRSSERRRPRC